MTGQRPWGVLAYIVADHANLPSGDADTLDTVAFQEAANMVNAARGRNDMYLSVHLDRTLTRGSLRMTVPGGIEELPEEEAGLEGLRRFLETAAVHCPADNYLVVLWGHGGGPLGMFSDPDPGPDGGTPRGELTLSELPGVLEVLRRGCSLEAVPIVLIKSCYAATLEAAYEIGPLAKYLVCSQARVPLRTWTIWETVFESLVRGGSPDGAAFGLIDAIARHYGSVTERNGRAEVPFSLLRPAEGRQVVSLVRELSARLLDMVDEPAVARAIERSRPTRGGDRALLDVRTLCAELRDVDEPGVMTLAYALDAFVGERLVARHTPTMSAFGGVGLFHFPPNPLERADSFANDVTRASYRRLALPRLTEWDMLAFPSVPAMKY